MYSDKFRCFQMCSVNAGNNRIISDNFSKTQGKIGECVSTVPPGVPPHLFTPIAFNMKIIQMDMRIKG